MTMNNHWGYNKADQNWKSTQTLIRNLIDCASKGGNYLLADTRFIGVSDKRLFINDAVNKRILSVRLGYQKEAEAGITK